MRKRLLRRIRYALGESARRRQLEEEMEHHVASMIDDLVGRGMTESEARMAAYRKFGNARLNAEDSRAVWISRWLTDAVQDLRYTARGLRRGPGFAVFAILIAGLGIGACVTVFSVVNALVLRPLPFKDPSRLVWVSNNGTWSLQSNYVLELKSTSKTMGELAGYFAFYGVGDLKLTGAGEPERLTGVKVTENLLPLLGVKLLAGRNFTHDECIRPFDDIPAVLLSYPFWQRRFASDRSIVGRKLILNDAPAIVAGVLPESFDFATVFAPGTRVDLLMPFALTEDANRRGNTLSVIGRLNPGATVTAARTEFRALGKRMTQEHPRMNPLDADVSHLDEHVNGRFRPALLALAGAVGVVMLIVCANLSNLQLARTATRQREIAVRAALGAGRRRLVRQMLVEGMALSLSGAAAGLGLACGGAYLIAHLTSFRIPLLATVRVDAAALWFTAAIAILSGIVFSLAPALQVTALTLNERLNEGGRGSTEGRARGAIRGMLAVAEIALACVLVMGAGLLIRSFVHVLEINPGFRPENTAALRIDPGSSYRTMALRTSYFNEALERVRAIGGVRAAGLTDQLPLAGDRSWGIAAKGELYDRWHNHDAFVRVVSDGYFGAMGVPLKQGRDFRESDDSSHPGVIIINETLARTLWPGRSAIGQILVGGGTGDREVIGVVGDVHHIGLEQDAGNEMYMPIRQTTDYGEVELVARSNLAPGALASAVRQTMKTIAPDLATNEVRTVQQLVDNATSPRRFIVMLLSGFSLFALLLAALGIYAVISYSVSQRTQEIGIRMAVGATAGDVQRKIVGRTLRLAVAGIVIGLAASWMVARGLTSLLFGVSASDPPTFAAMPAIIIVAAAIAGYLPARKASRIDPVEALRTT